ncbi:MAG TPA: alpha/beta hydrolase [Vicinamibacterales bacterium]
MFTRLPLSVTIAAVLGSALLAQSPAPTPAREATADLPGVHLFFTDSGGSGEPVIFVHAATGSSRVWEYQRAAFAARRYRVITYDRRGYGRSVADPSGPQPGTGADDLNALMDYLKIDRFHLVGTAAGGFVAWDYALSFPKRLRSLVVANSIGGVQDPEYQAAMQRLRTPDFLAMSPDMRELGPAYRVSNPSGADRWRELERTARPTSAQPPPQTFRNRVTFALLETISLPTLLLTGDADMYAPPPIMRMFAAHVKGSKAVVIPEAGHSGYWEQPEFFNRTVLEFISKH